MSGNADPHAGRAQPQGAERPRSGEPEYGLDVLPPLYAVAELAAILSLFMVVDWVWPQLDIHNLQPSVYWLPVLLLSLQYGTASGSLAAVVAIAATFALATLPEQGVGENEFAYRLRILAQPILWIGTAVLLGQFRMVQIAAKRELLERVIELEEQGRTLAGYAQGLRTRCDALEREIVARPEPVERDLLGALARLRQGAAAAGPEIERILAACAPGGTASLFQRAAGGFQRVASSGWPAGAAPWHDALAADHPLVAAMTGARRALSVLDEGDEAALGGEGLAAVPVVDQASGRVVGMVKIEAAAANVVTPQLTAALGIAAEAIAPRIAELSSAPSVAMAGPPVAPRTPAAPIPLRPLSEKFETLAAPARGPVEPGRDPGRAWPKAGT